MKKDYCTVADKKHLDSLTRDYREAGWFIVTYGKTLRELERGDEFITIEIVQPKRSDLERPPWDGRPVLKMADQKGKDMEKRIFVLSPEQEARRKARIKAIEELEYNPMCYDCKKFKKECPGEKKTLYSGCVYKEADRTKKSIYAQINEKIYKQNQQGSRCGSGFDSRTCF